MNTMRRSQSSDHGIAMMATRQPLRLVKSRSEAVINPGGKVAPQPLSPLNSDDEDEEDEVMEHDEEDHYEEARSEQEEEDSPRTQSVIFNTTTAGLEKMASNSVININNIVNITGTATGTSVINNKIRAESFPLSEVEALRKELLEHKRGMDRLKKQNQLLAEENTAMKKLLETGGGDHSISSSPSSSFRDHPKHAPLSPSVAVVKVGYLIKRGFTWHNWCSRWCVLRWSTLTYFKSPSDTKPKGLFHLQGCEVEEYLDPKKPFTFTVQSRNRLWYFQATSQNEQRSWMHAIKSAAQDRSSLTLSKGSSDISEISSPQPKNMKLFRFFGEEPTQDWSEDDNRPRVSIKKLDFLLPAPKEIMEFVSEKEAKVIDESGLSLKQVHVNYAAFLSCAYFVSRDRYFKKRISEYNAMSKKVAQEKTHGESASSISVSSNSTISNISGTSSPLPPRHRGTNRHSVSYSDASIGKLLSMENPRETFSFLEKVGKGGFANVYRAKHKGNKSIVAVKVLSQKFEKRNAKMCHEVSMLMTCNHPNIIKNVQNFLYNEEIYMVTEYCEIGSLDRMLKLELKESAIAFIIGQVLNGLVYLHNMGRVHRDIKTSNILVNSLGNVKIADLGLCEDIRSGPINGKMSGSKYWLAPEVIARQPYSTPVDIWNLGGLCCAMVTKSPPNGTMHPIKAMYLTAVQGVSVSEILPKSQGWSDDFRDFASQCFRMDPTTRPTATALLQHPFLKAGKRADLIPLVNACIIAGYIV
eukprot:Phypoly_transcript_00813.p1 GENE.Phypoly_transcript_00813~~Phypoly_transcript_00813.p1  ORF type:complete len:753 (+),score=90.98 Phypoly_transcript_00813:85-2343(+)